MRRKGEIEESLSPQQLRVLIFLMVFLKMSRKYQIHRSILYNPIMLWCANYKHFSYHPSKFWRSQ